MTTRMAKARLLIEHLRFKDAEQELGQELALNPNNSHAHSLLALTLTAQQKHKQAIRQAQIGLELDPSASYHHFILALALERAKHYKKAMSAIQEAIRIHPRDARYYEILSKIHLHEGEWQDALTVAERGLAIDPKNIVCMNRRAMALIKLGRQEESEISIETALAQGPENAFSHANQGWMLMHRGDHEKAMEHFRESLRLNPTSDWARSGIVEALKSHNPIYRITLQHFLWLSRLSVKIHWGISIGAGISYWVVYGISIWNPNLSLFLRPLLFLYIAFALWIWTSDHLLNLLLRLNPLGRLSLSRNEIAASNWAGACILVALITFGISIPSNDPIKGVLRGVVTKSLVMIMPIEAVFKVRTRRNRTVLITFAILLGAIGAVHVILSLIYAPIDVLELGFWLGTILYLGVSIII